MYLPTEEDPMLELQVLVLNINEGILVDFLSREKKEAVMFAMFEHNEEEEWRKFKADERELGREEGIKEGIKEGIEQGIKQGINESIHRLMKNMGISEEEARVALGLKSRVI